VITAHEAKSLVALLHSSDELLLERTLATICNCGTFSANQVIQNSLSLKHTPFYAHVLHLQNRYP
jgi:hypothetical protein